jgi:DNA gyrase subunit B
MFGGRFTTWVFPSPTCEESATATRPARTFFSGPATSVFTNAVFHYDILAKRLRELSFLNSGVRIELKDERTGKGDVFEYKGGIRSFVEHLARNKNPLHPTVMHLADEQRDLGGGGHAVDGRLPGNVFCYTNNIPQKDGGAHLAGFRAALTRTINQYIEESTAGRKDKFRHW